LSYQIIDQNAKSVQRIKICLGKYFHLLSKHKLLVKKKRHIIRFEDMDAEHKAIRHKYKIRDILGLILRFIV